LLKTWQGKNLPHILRLGQARRHLCITAQLADKGLSQSWTILPLMRCQVEGI
jgi:hypothetical protein